MSLLCAKTFEAVTRSALFLYFLDISKFKKEFIVLIPFLFAIFAIFFAGSIPNIFLNFFF